MKKMAWSKARLRGSMTVEAAFIVPIIIVGIVAVIWLNFYLLNSVKLTSDAELLVFNAETEIVNMGYECEPFRKNVEDRLGGYGFGRIYNAELDYDGSNISVCLDLHMNIPQKGILGRMVSNMSEIHVEKKITVPERENITRIITVAWDAVEEIAEAVQGGTGGK